MTTIRDEAFTPDTRAGSSTPAIDVRDLRMSYGSNQVLKGVNLRIEPGQIVAILGPNGAGKTTTIEILEGFRVPSAGHVRVLDEDPGRPGPAWRARVGIVLQSWRDHSRWTVRELLTHFANHYRFYASPDRTRPHDVADVIARVGLQDKADTALSALSGGQRRRMDVAIGIIGNPEVLFLDEPTTGFDPQARKDFHTLIRDQVRNDGTTVVLTTHNLHEAEALADRIVILLDGKVAADGSASELAATIASQHRVEWVEDGSRQSQLTPDSTALVRTLMTDPQRDVHDLKVIRPTLEETYLHMVSSRSTEES